MIKWIMFLWIPIAGPQPSHLWAPTDRVFDDRAECIAEGTRLSHGVPQLGFFCERDCVIVDHPVGHPEIDPRFHSDDSSECPA